MILSDEGRLEACYLGAEPSLFVAPPIHRRGFDYKAAENELVELRKAAKICPNTSENQLIIFNFSVFLLPIHMVMLSYT